jgi:hypothetical protein
MSAIRFNWKREKGSRYARVLRGSFNDLERQMMLAGFFLNNTPSLFVGQIFIRGDR